MTSRGIGRKRSGGAATSVDDRPNHAYWPRAILSSIHEGVLVFDPTGLVLEMNQAFTDMFGYTMEDGPIVPPYPWWPTEDEDPEGLSSIQERHGQARAGLPGTREFRFFNGCRTPVWAACADATITNACGDLVAVVRTFRDVTGEKNAQSRREAAARLSADFADPGDLETLISGAQHGLEMLFDGDATVELHLDARYLFSGGHSITPDELTDGARSGLAGTTSPDATNPRPGILLLPRTSITGCRVWVQFPRARRIGPDEMIVADLLAQAFALAADRLITAQRAAHSKDHMQRAIESHRQIGQAVGILVERHRILPAQAFDRIRVASQTRNIKLRDIAARIIETGAAPEDA